MFSIEFFVGAFITTIIGIIVDSKIKFINKLTKKIFKRRFTKWGKWEIKGYDPTNPPKWGLSDDKLVFIKNLGNKKCYEAKTTTYAIKLASEKDWKCEKIVTTRERPADTLTEKYVSIGSDWDRTGGKTTPYMIFRKFTRELRTETSTKTEQVVYDYSYKIKKRNKL